MRVTFFGDVLKHGQVTVGNFGLNITDFEVGEWMNKGSNIDGEG